MYRTFLDETNESLRQIVENNPELKSIYKPRESLGERYVSEENPSFVFNEFLTDSKALLTDMEIAYARSATNRNALNDEVADKLKDLLELTANTLKAMRNAPPEDTNT